MDTLKDLLNIHKINSYKHNEISNVTINNGNDMSG